jgi:hypothetical protein
LRELADASRQYLLQGNALGENFGDRAVAIDLPLSTWREKSECRHT